MFFTPPHRGRFMPHSYPGTDSDTEPLASIKPDLVPQPVNIYVWADGSLHEEEPEVIGINDTIPGWARRIYASGHIYGPLSDAEITELTTAGYGAYLTTNPKPEPQP